MEPIARFHPVMGFLLMKVQFVLEETVLALSKMFVLAM